jgi:outer membrane receptor protein involved in Fe transport
MKPFYRNPFGTLWASVLYAANLGVSVTLPAFAAAQEWTRAASADDVAAAGPASATARDANELDLEEVIVTAVPGNPSSKLNSSLSVSTLTQGEITQSDPSSAADIVRNIPGFRSQASGGEGNANISARGLPMHGGSKYVQLQEDGLAILQYGDIDFATADQWLRSDYNVEHIEAVRGGSSSTATSDAPGGVINFISKDGSREGGNVGITSGLDYHEMRYDFDYGAPLSDTTRFHIGGFYHSGEGPRSTDYRSVNGGQIKGNITHDIDDGFIRLNFKWLDDRSPVYLPVPIMLNGRSAGNFPGFSANSGVLQTPALLIDTAVNAQGERVTTDIADGYHSTQTSFGGEFVEAFAGGWRIEDKFRHSSMGGDFVGPYPQNVGTTAALTATLGYPGGTMTYATGANAGQPFTGYAAEVALFNVTLPDMDNFINDVKVRKDLGGPAGGSASVYLGLYYSTQNVVEDWHWNTYLEQAQGRNAALLNLTSAAGEVVTANGLFAYGDGAFGNCCVRYYDLHYETTAPYLDVGWRTARWNLDGSVRYDVASASGSYGSATGTTVMNVGNTPALTVPDLNVPIVNTYFPLNYTKDYLSYSIGVNYAVDPDLAVFARTSNGARFNAERLLFGNGVVQSGPGTGSTSQSDAVNHVRQTEAGVKYAGDGLSVFATAFYVRTQETNSDFTNLAEPYINDIFHAYGLEIEAAARFRDFSIHGGVTYTDATVASAQDNPQSVGKQPSNLARWIYQVTPSYSHGPFTAGFNLIGQSDSFVDNLDTTIEPGFVEVNLFAQYDFRCGIQLSIRGNNIFNVIGLTEVESTSVGRSINGRTFEGTLKYSF